MGMMATDFFLLRHRRIKLSHLYRPGPSSDYWFFHGVNLRAVPCWLAGWAPTIGGLVVTVQENVNASKALYELFYMAFLVGFFISGTLFYILNMVWPPVGLGEMDEVDYYGTFTEKEAMKVGVTTLVPAEEVVIVQEGDKAVEVGSSEKPGEKV